MKYINEIVECLSNIGVQVDSEDHEALLIDAGLDSLSLALFVVEIEKNLSIKIHPTEANEDNFSNLKRLHTFIESKK